MNLIFIILLLNHSKEYEEKAFIGKLHKII